MTSPNSSVLTILFLSNNSTHLGSGRTFLLIELWETTTVHFTKTRNCWDYLVMCHTVSCILLLFLSENKDSILTFYAHSLPRHRTFCNSFYSEKIKRLLTSRFSDITIWLLILGQCKPKCYLQRPLLLQKTFSQRQCMVESTKQLKVIYINDNINMAYKSYVYYICS